MHALLCECTLENQQAGTRKSSEYYGTGNTPTAILSRNNALDTSRLAKREHRFARLLLLQPPRRSWTAAKGETIWLHVHTHHALCNTCAQEIADGAFTWVVIRLATNSLPPSCGAGGTYGPRHD